MSINPEPKTKQTNSTEHLEREELVSSSPSLSKQSWLLKHRKPGGLYDKARIPVKTLNGFITGAIIITLLLIMYFATFKAGFTVSFDSVGGSDVAAQTVFYGQSLTEPEAPQRSGYSFDAWYFDKQYSRICDFTCFVVEGDLTLYAKWDASP